MPRPLILYVPGLLPKPPRDTHREALLNCLLVGLRRVDSGVARQIEEQRESFDIVAWTYDFYSQHRDIELDRAAIEALLAQTAASEADIAEASSWNRGLLRWLFRLGDLLPFLIPYLAPKRSKEHLRDFYKYEDDKDGVGQRARDLLKAALLDAAGQGRPTLVVGHSMGSIIAFDALWGLSHIDHSDLQLDMLLTMGSPLGQRFMRKNFRGTTRFGRERYPNNIKRWKNLAAHGDLTSTDPHLADDYSEMVTLGLVERIEDERLWNYYRYDGRLNPHSEYGYLANEVTARTIAKWWRSHVEDGLS